MKRSIQFLYLFLTKTETPTKQDYKEFAEKVFEAYTNIIVKAIEARMKACANNLIKHSDSIKYCDDKYITYIRKSELKQIAKALYWVEDKSDIGKYTFQDLIDVIDEYRELK